MSDRDTFGGDDNEPVRYSDEHKYFITRQEFQNLYNTTKEMNDKISGLCKDVTKIITHYENDTKNKLITLETAKQKATKEMWIIGIIVSTTVVLLSETLRYLHIS